MTPLTPPDRRLFLTAAGLAAASTAGLAGCSNKPGLDMNKPKEPVTLPVGDVPEGGGVILKGKGYVVTQPKGGEYRAFNSTCPHAGCEVTSVAENKIICGCHNSQFNLDDGSVLQGPATSGLGKAKLEKDGDTLTVSG